MVSVRDHVSRMPENGSWALLRDQRAQESVFKLLGSLPGPNQKRPGRVSDDVFRILCSRANLPRAKGTFLIRFPERQGKAASASTRRKSV